MLQNESFNYNAGYLSVKHLLTFTVSRLFERINSDDFINEDLYRYVEGVKGIKVVCEEVSCVFEFLAYRFIGKDLYVEKAAIVDRPAVVIDMNGRRASIEQDYQTPQAGPSPSLTRDNAGNPVLSTASTGTTV